ncbi:hypothetical protein BYT27DRAFT_6433620 [Phlegmacium glaucopus]|nr:hypothetical protein BYT27DRAFT_6433620 [Phlegmacium glaucopus]
MTGFHSALLRLQEAGPRDLQKITRRLILKNQTSVRSPGGTRVIDSAPQLDFGHYAYNPALSVIHPEHLNDTLDDKMYPNAGSPDTQTNLWRLNIRYIPLRCRLEATTFCLDSEHIQDSDNIQIGLQFYVSMERRASSMPITRMLLHWFLC